MAMNVKKGDTVVVLSGKDKGKKGKVQSTKPSEAKVVVEGVNLVTCHTKPRRQGEEGGIVRREARCRSSAPSAASPPALPTRLRAARRRVCASTAAPSFKERGRKELCRISRQSTPKRPLLL